MPTPHKRIGVVEDEELRDALDAVSSDFDGTPKASVVHRLAIEGARAWTERRRADDRHLDELVRRSTHRDESLDWALLERIDQHAWSSE